ncbi:hypothetical protein [Brevundimonas sp. AAP58]|uniref:hypothetical protein n=1 Tax=Brevundimonas sp. AAP58 TaxID=1523422 RepID=UPI0006B9DE89|nr:hypothetical protein [Brevundimonas sp. AAP58]
MLDRRGAIGGLTIAPIVAAARLAPSSTATLTAAELIRLAHDAAGGPTWLRPRSLTLTGQGRFWPQGTHAGSVDIPDYRMWRVYPTESTEAHAANGWVRIDARRADGSVYFQAAYDGETSYDQNGVVPGAEASREWSENFGFGIIRFALDEGFALRRLPDDTADGRPIHVVRIADPSGGETLFGIATDDHSILWLGFETPRGWHERCYSDFYRNPGVSFTQPGRVRLFYDGVKQNEIRWTGYALNEDLPRSLFRIAR